MELNELWKKLEKQKLEVVKPTSLVSWPPQSKHPVEKLRKAFLTALILCVLFEGIFTYLIIAFSHPLVRGFMSLVFLSYIFFFVINYRVYKKIVAEIDFSQNVLETFKSIYKTVTEGLRFQRKASLFIYPIAASAGFLLGFSVHQDPNRVIQETALLLSMIGAAVVLTPLSYLLARWMEKVSYGKYCDQLKEMIQSLEHG